jgi:hypothetical protein
MTSQLNLRGLKNLLSGGSLLARMDGRCKRGVEFPMEETLRQCNLMDGTTTLLTLLFILTTSVALAQREGHHQTVQIIGAL